MLSTRHQIFGRLMLALFKAEAAEAACKLFPPRRGDNHSTPKGNRDQIFPFFDSCGLAQSLIQD
jgi:hypothetical protein